MESTAPVSSPPGAEGTLTLPLPLATESSTDPKPSIVPGLTVGQMRVCLAQIRATQDFIQPQSILANNQSAGWFALKYVIAILEQRSKASRAAARRAMEKPRRRSDA